MFPATCIVLLSVVFPLRMSNCEHLAENSYLSVPNDFLKGVENCDLQLLHNGISSSYFSFLQDILLPRTILVVPLIHKIGEVSSFETFVLDILKSRPGPDKMSIWLSKLLLKTEKKYRTDSTYFYAWLLFSSSYHYGFQCEKCNHNVVRGHDWNFVQSNKNVYPIVLTHFDVLETAKILRIYHRISENFLMAFISHSGLSEVCLMRIGFCIGGRQNFVCKQIGRRRVLANFWKLVTLPKAWSGTYGPIDRQEEYGTLLNKDLPHPRTNPFGRENSINIPLYMAVIIVTGTNASLEFEQGSISYPIVTIETREVDSFQYQKLSEYSLQYQRLSEFTYTSGYQFLTCYAESYLSFDFYLTPFQPTLWVSFLISVLLTFMVLYFYTSWKHHRPPYAVWWSFVSLFLDDSSSVPQVIGSALFYRLLFCTWGPVAVLLTNCYSGLMISELNAPLKQARARVFEDLVCQSGSNFKIPTVPEELSRWAERVPFENYKAYWGQLFSLDESKLFIRNDFALDDCYSMVSSPFQIIGRTTYFWYSMLSVEFINNFNLLLSLFIKNPKIPSTLSSDNILTFSFMNPVHRQLPEGMNLTRNNYSTNELQALAERDTINCEGKTVFVSTLEAVQSKMVFLNKHYPSKKFHSGERLLDQAWFGWTFERGGRSSKSSSVSAVQRNFQALVYSGIYSRLKIEMARKTWLRRNPVANDTTTNIVSPLTMNEGLITIFMISGVLLALAAVSLVIEGYKYDWYGGLMSCRRGYASIFCRKYCILRLKKCRKQNRRISDASQIVVNPSLEI
ncbi:hypothetical protein Fcan01_22781 [Folsomia candida]|uniref:Uncharacterized protein n=1 Tax=Folsomia candida TaxID=158441 RepID=A0A226DC55_FOLCA|nr:hypothetical protein Fcan01_22781 [Folsomia candida]